MHQSKMNFGQSNGMLIRIDNGQVQIPMGLARIHATKSQGLKIVSAGFKVTGGPVCAASHEENGQASNHFWGYGKARD